MPGSDPLARTCEHHVRTNLRARPYLDADRERSILPLFRLRLRRTQIKNPVWGMQTPLETSVQALRNTRPVEKICAWMTAEIPFHRVPLMHDSAPRRRRLSSALGMTPILPGLKCLWPMRQRRAIRPNRNRAAAMCP